MTTSQQLKNLNLADFTLLYSQSIIQQETEKIIGLVLEEQYMKKNDILLYNVTNISELYVVPIVDLLKKKLLVSSIYLQNKSIYIDWSLSHKGNPIS